ncbi:MAG: hypothetical protein J7L14_03705 [Candidatus Diapherotrites archaeon]|nr:hypothetical protein [Candidatus Diapherotrites archaeon]
MKLVRTSKYDSSQCNGRFIFFSPEFDELAVKWFFPYDDEFNLKHFLKIYPELSETDVEIVTPSQSDIILACNYSEIDAAVTSALCSTDFDAQRFFRKWKGEVNQIEWQTPDCDVWCSISLTGYCPHPESCPYRQPYFYTDIAVVVAPETVADIWLVPNAELDFWVNDARFVKRIKNQLRR